MPLPPIFEPNTSQQAAAVRLLVGTFPLAEQTAQQERFQQWLALPPSHGFALRCIGDDPQKPLAALLYQILPGKVALLWPPAVSSSADSAICETFFHTLLSHLHTQLAPEGIELVQLLLPAGEDSAPPDARLLARIFTGGYQRLARLLYLYLSDQQQSFPAKAPECSSFSLRPAKELSVSQLEALIEQTYIGTQDCPQMSGLRSPSQVLAGYRAAGDCGDQFWFIPTSPAGEPLGCLLLAPDRSQKTCELVYIGVVPSARGQGIAGQLLTWAKWYTKVANCNQILLAVDDQNLPGLRLYSRHGFQSFDARLVYVHRLGAASSQTPC